MNVTTLKGLIPVDEGRVNVDHVAEIETHFFKFARGEDYRNRAIDFMIKRNIPIHSSHNNQFELAKRFLNMVCPRCGKTMKSSGGGGTSEHMTINFDCVKKCGTRGSIDVPLHGIEFSFSRKIKTK